MGIGLKGQFESLDTKIARVCTINTIVWMTVLLATNDFCKILVLNDSLYIAWVYIVANNKK